MALSWNLLIVRFEGKQQNYEDFDTKWVLRERKMNKCKKSLRVWKSAYNMMNYLMVQGPAIFL